ANVKVTVVDYGIGNLHSVVKALRHEGGDVRVESTAAALRDASRLVLPGVGAFGDGMRELTSRGILEPLLDYMRSGRPFLGICLGMQVLLEQSEEFGKHVGLGLVRGVVAELKKAPGIKIPHVGWNSIQPPTGRSWRGTMLEDVAPGTMVYFVHSFAAAPSLAGDVLCEASYGPNRFAAAIRRENVVGCQFHPEKSGTVGLSMLRRFLTS
ncbi:MAG: imidazole glycerol phosphate synthase subunit HisH, partial [Polyangiaceae bacterium]